MKPGAQRPQRMNPAVVPGGVGGLQLSGRGEAGEAESGEAGDEGPGVLPREGGALKMAGPGFEEGQQIVRKEEGKDADGPQTGRVEEEGIRIDLDHAGVERQVRPVQPPQLP